MKTSLQFLIPAILVSAVIGADVRGLAAESREQMRLAVGEAKTITLSENPSTGFQWKVDEAQSSNLDVVRISDLGHEEAQGHLIGAPGTHSWRIEGVTPGKARLVLDYLRSWEHVAPAERHIADIEVAPRQ